MNELNQITVGQEIGLFTRMVFVGRQPSFIRTVKVLRVTAANVWVKIEHCGKPVRFSRKNPASSDTMIGEVPAAVVPAMKLDHSQPKEQEVRVLIDVSVTMRTKYSAQEVKEIVYRGARRVFANNDRTYNEVKFAEEAALYSPDTKEIVWQPVVRLSEGAQSQLCPAGVNGELLAALMKCEKFLSEVARTDFGGVDELHAAQQAITNATRS